MTNLHLFWDGADAPAGWTLVSGVGGAFYQKLVRGNSTYGGTGGAAAHTHTISSSCSGPSLTTGAFPAGSLATSSAHTHPSGSISVDSKSNLPSYRGLKVIKCDTEGTPTTIPAGAIALFDASTPSGWIRYSAQDDYYIYCLDTASGTGGSNTHQHTVSGTTAAASSTGVSGGLGNSASYVDHTHTFSQVTDIPNNEPSYITSYLGKKDSDGAPVVGTIGMWDGTPPSGWTVLSDEGGALYQAFIRAANEYGTTGGSSAHSHTDVSNATGSSSSIVTVGGSTPIAKSDHTHTLTVSLSAADHTPPYIEVIFAKYTGEAFMRMGKYW